MPNSDSLSLRLRLCALTLLRRITRRLIKQKAHDQAFPCGHSPFVACRCTVSGSISLPSPGFFSPFPHGTSSLSVSKEYLALEDGPPARPKSLLQTGFHVSRLTFRTLTLNLIFTYRAITFYGRLFQTVLLISLSFPRSGCFPFARHYLGNLG